MGPFPQLIQHLLPLHVRILKLYYCTREYISVQSVHVDFKAPFFSSKRARYFLRVLFTINIFVCIIFILAYCYNNRNISSLLRMISTEPRICIYFLSLSKKYTAGDNKKAIMLRWLQYTHFICVCTCSIVPREWDAEQFLVFVVCCTRFLLQSVQAWYKIIGPTYFSSLCDCVFILQVV